MRESSTNEMSFLNSGIPMFMASLVDPVIASLVYSLISGALGSENAKDELCVSQTVGIMNKKIESMPKYMTIAIVILTVMFDWYGVLRTNKRFHRQCLTERHGQIQQWKNSKIGICRDFIGFYEKMTMFVYYSLSASLY